MVEKVIKEKEPKGALFYLIRTLQILIIALALFIIVLVVWENIWGVPCWAFMGGEINDSVTWEIIQRCSK